MKDSVRFNVLWGSPRPRREYWINVYTDFYGNGAPHYSPKFPSRESANTHAHTLAQMFTRGYILHVKEK
jgi:hypothetical protein